MGQHYSLKEKNQDKEIQRRIMAGWAAYAKHRDIFKSNLAICLKRQVYNSCVVPAMTYGAETWTLTKQAQNKLAAAQTKMERSTVKPLYSEQSRDPTIFSLYGGVHPRGVRYVHAHMCLKYIVHILKLFRPCSSGGRAIFHDSFFSFYIFRMFCTCVQYMYFS